MSTNDPLQPIRTALRAGDLVVVAGPEFDRLAELPMLPQLVGELTEHALATGSTSLSREGMQQLVAHGRIGEAFEQLEFSLGRSALTRAVVDRLSTGYHVPQLLRTLATLQSELRAIYTTSLVDGLFTRALGGRWPTYDEPRPHLAQQRGLVFHLRGTLARTSGWVLTQTQQQRELRPDSPRGALLGAVYRAHRMLLVGFAPQDPELRSLLDMLPAVADGMAPEHFALIEGSCTPELRRWLATRGFEVVTGDTQQQLTALAGEVAGSDGAQPTGQCPYPGLEAFDEAHAGLFFGRHVEVSHAAARLGVTGEGESRRWLAVEGPSGVGKSSFVHAGVVPALRNGFARGTPGRFRVARMRPGSHPLHALTVAIWHALDGEARVSIETLAAQVRHHPDALAHWIGDHLQPGYGLLLVVDQFEESVTFAEQAERHTFGHAIARLVGTPSVYLITTVRTDFVPAIQSGLPMVASLLNDYAERYALPAISRVGLRDAIVEPAAREGVSIEPGLVEAMLADADPGTDIDADGHPRSSTAALPLVAHILRTLWEAGAAADGVIELREYQALGGVRGALSRSAELALAGLDANGVAGAEALLLGLVGIRADGTTTRRTIERSEATALAGGGAIGEQVLLRLSGASAAHGSHTARLLVVYRDGASERVDLVHEALLRDWARYQVLIDRNRRQLLLDDELHRRAERWANSGKRGDDLPTGHALAELLEGRPRGANAQIHRDYQRALRSSESQRIRSQRRRRMAWVAVSVVVAIASLGAAARFAIQNKQLQTATANANRARDNADDAKDKLAKQVKVAQDALIQAQRAEERAINEADRAHQEQLRAERQTDRANAEANAATLANMLADARRLETSQRTRALVVSRQAYMFAAKHGLDRQAAQSQLIRAFALQALWAQDVPPMELRNDSIRNGWTKVEHSGLPEDYHEVFRSRGSLLVALGFEYYSRHRDQTLTLFASPEREITTVTGVDGMVLPQVKVSTDERYAMLLDGRRARLFDVASRKPIAIDSRGNVVHVAMSPSGRFAAYGTDQGIVHLVAVGGFTHYEVADHDSEAITALQFSTDGKYLVATSDSFTRSYAVESITMPPRASGYFFRMDPDETKPTDTGGTFWMSFSNGPTEVKWTNAAGKVVAKFSRVVQVEQEIELPDRFRWSARGLDDAAGQDVLDLAFGADDSGMQFRRFAGFSDDGRYFMAGTQLYLLDVDTIMAIVGDRTRAGTIFGL